jgi:hypothetical protein
MPVVPGRPTDPDPMQNGPSMLNLLMAAAQMDKLGKFKPIGQEEPAPYDPHRPPTAMGLRG